LRQIGQIPLLSRGEELRLARRIEFARRRWRRGLLECGLVIRDAVDTLHRVADRELSLDRTVQFSASARLEKHQIEGRLPHNLRTLDELLRRNRRDFDRATRKSLSRRTRRAAWRALVRRRRRAVRLVEELGLRIEHLEQQWPRLEQHDRRVRQLATRIEQLKAAGAPEEQLRPLAKRDRRNL
jgi:RNA polymerase primary sigma factor